MKIKMKRKDFDQFYDDFSDFSLSSPAMKIRRLNAELPPIMEVDHLPDISLSNEECVIQKSEDVPTSVAPPDSEPGDFAISENQERAIILFKPVNPLIAQASTSSPLSVTVDSNLISGFKSEFYNSTRYFEGKNHVEDGEKIDRDADNVINKCTAVVPWVPSQLLSSHFMPSKSLEHAESESEVTAMDIEQSSERPLEMRQQQLDEYRAMNGAWHQHHCMITQLPPSPPAPIPWFH